MVPRNLPHTQPLLVEVVHRRPLFSPKCGVIVYNPDRVWLQWYPEIHHHSPDLGSLLVEVVPRCPLVQPKCGVIVYNPDLVWLQWYPEIHHTHNHCWLKWYIDVHYFSPSVGSLFTILILFGYSGTQKSTTHTTIVG